MRHALAAGWEGEVRVPGDSGNHPLCEWWHRIWAAVFAPGLVLVILLSWGECSSPGGFGLQGQEAWSCGTVDSISLGQVLGAIQLLKLVGRLCGLQWELGQSPVWGEACGKQAESKRRCSVACSELTSAFLAESQPGLRSRGLLTWLHKFKYSRESQSWSAWLCQENPL